MSALTNNMAKASCTAPRIASASVNRRMACRMTPVPKVVSESKFFGTQFFGTRMAGEGGTCFCKLSPTYDLRPG